MSPSFGGVPDAGPTDKKGTTQDPVHVGREMEGVGLGEWGWN